jgi:hypothetical protein
MVRKLFRALLVAYVFAVVIRSTAHCEPALALKVYPNQAYGPVKVRFTVVIEPNANNRKACLAYDGPEASLSCWQVDGDNHPRTQWVNRLVSAEGDYFATLTLVSVVPVTDKSGKVTGYDVKHVTESTQFHILEPGVPFVR